MNVDPYKRIYSGAARSFENEGRSLRYKRAREQHNENDRQELPAQVGKSNEFEGADDAGLVAMLMALDDHIEQEAEKQSAFLMTLNGLLDLGPKGEEAVRKEIRSLINHGL